MGPGCWFEPPQSLLCGGRFSPNGGVLTTSSESWCQNHLADQQLHQLLEKVDLDLAEQAHQQGCLFCGGKLHRANLSVFTIIEGECFRIDEGVAGDPGWSWRVVTAERL